MDDLDIFLVQAIQAGASISEISSAITMCGDPMGPDDIEKRLRVARERLAMPKTATKKTTAVPLSDLEREAVKIISALIDQRLAEKDAEIEAIRKQMEGLQDKANKYDALKGLLG